MCGIAGIFGREEGGIGKENDHQDEAGRKINMKYYINILYNKNVVIDCWHDCGSMVRWLP